jgi:hypothetical protein
MCIFMYPATYLRGDPHMTSWSRKKYRIAISRHRKVVEPFWRWLRGGLGGTLGGGNRVSDGLDAPEPRYTTSILQYYRHLPWCHMWMAPFTSLLTLWYAKCLNSSLFYQTWALESADLAISPCKPLSEWDLILFCFLSYFFLKGYRFKVLK